MKSIKALRNEYGQKARNNLWSHDRCMTEARRMATSQEWVADLPPGWTAVINSRNQQNILPGEEVISGGVTQNPSYRWYYIGAGYHGNSYTVVMLRNDGKRVRSSRCSRRLIHSEHLAHNDSTPSKIAQQMVNTGDFRNAPLLADALEEAGCANWEVLEPLRRVDMNVVGTAPTLEHLDLEYDSPERRRGIESYDHYHFISALVSRIARGIC